MSQLDTLIRTHTLIKKALFLYSIIFSLLFSAGYFLHYPRNVSPINLTITGDTVFVPVTGADFIKFEINDSVTIHYFETKTGRENYFPARVTNRKILDNKHEYIICLSVENENNPAELSTFTNKKFWVEGASKNILRMLLVVKTSQKPESNKQ